LVRAGTGPSHADYDVCRDIKVLTPVLAFLGWARRSRGTISNNGLQVLALIFLDPSIALAVLERIGDRTK
jgi:hypothetical protein